MVTHVTKTIFDTNQRQHVDGEAYFIQVGISHTMIDDLFLFQCEMFSTDISPQPTYNQRRSEAQYVE